MFILFSCRIYENKDRLCLFLVLVTMKKSRVRSTCKHRSENKCREHLKGDVWMILPGDCRLGSQLLKPQRNKVYGWLAQLCSGTHANQLYEANWATFRTKTARPNFKKLFRFRLNITPLFISFGSLFWPPQNHNRVYSFSSSMFGECPNWGRSMSWLMCPLVLPCFVFFVIIIARRIFCWTAQSLFELTI